MEPLDVVRLLAALLAGAVIGLERELHDKPAGFRTNTMICIGAALFTLLSIRMAPGIADPTRIAAQIVTGVGFLGAGAIIQFRGNVIGLTTAATIWAVASLGMAFGAGFYGLGSLATILVAAVLFGMSSTEHRIGRWRSVAHLEIETTGPPEPIAQLRKIILDHGVRIRWITLTKEHAALVVAVAIVGSEEALERLQTSLVNHPQIMSLRRM